MLNAYSGPVPYSAHKASVNEQEFGVFAKIRSNFPRKHNRRGSPTKKFVSILLVVMMLMLSVSASAAFENMQKGSKGDGVKDVQTLLINQGYLTGTADGAFGNGTAKAVKAFQAANGLEETGIVDEETYGKLAGWDKCTHEFGEYTVTAEVTCTANGEEMAVCNLCGMPEYAVIEATGHNLVQSTNVSAQVCSVCGLMEGEVEIGAEVSSEEHSFEFKDVYYTNKVSEKHGNITTSMQEGSYMVLKLAFTNLSVQAFERWHSDRVTDMVLTFDGKYVYEGETWTVDDIVPLDTKNLYIVYSVPEMLKDNTDKPMVAEFTLDGQAFSVNIADVKIKN